MLTRGLDHLGRDQRLVADGSVVVLSLVARVDHTVCFFLILDCIHVPHGPFAGAHPASRTSERDGQMPQRAALVLCNRTSHPDYGSLEGQDLVCGDHSAVLTMYGDFLGCPCGDQGGLVDWVGLLEAGVMVVVTHVLGDSEVYLLQDELAYRLAWRSNSCPDPA